MVCVCIHTNMRICTRVDYYSAIKNEILPRYLESMVLSEMSDRERQTLCDFTHMWNIKYKQNKGTDQIKHNTEVQGREWWLPEGRGRGGRVEWVKRVNCMVVMSSSGLVATSCMILATAWTVTHQAPLSMGFSRQEYWNGLPFPSSGDLPNSGIELTSPASQADSLPLSHQGSPW